MLHSIMENIENNVRMYIKVIMTQFTLSGRSWNLEVKLEKRVTFSNRIFQISHRTAFILLQISLWMAATWDWITGFQLAGIKMNRVARIFPCRKPASVFSFTVFKNDTDYLVVFWSPVWLSDRLLAIAWVLSQVCCI